MAMSYTTSDGVTLYLPGAYPSITVQPSPGGLAATGVIALVGEADQGPDYASEENLSLNFFGPSQSSAVVAKYKSGNLVDAFQACVAAANDPQIQGAPSRIYIVKTNVGAKGTSGNDLLKVGGGVYGVLADKSYGKLGNLIYWTVSSKTAEVVPSTGAFTFLVPMKATVVQFVVDGVLEASFTGLTQGILPPAAQAAIDASSANIACTGGADRVVVSAANVIAGAKVAITVSDAVATFTLSVVSAWAVTPTVGDTLYVKAAGVLVGAGNVNIGSYVVTSATSNTIVATKLNNAPGTDPSLALANPAAVTAVAVAVDSFTCYAPLVISNETAVAANGAGQTLEIAEVITDYPTTKDKLSNLCYSLNTTKVPWISTVASPYMLVSSAEYAVNLNVNRQVDGVQEILGAGGQIALQLAYYGGTAATVTISEIAGIPTLTTAVTGGAGSALSINLNDYSTIGDLAAYINSQPGYSANPGTSLLGQSSPLTLDYVSAVGICTQQFVAGSGNTTTNISLAGRIKNDAYKFFQAISGSVAVQLGTTTVERADCGIPALQTTTKWLAGGSKGSTTQAVVQSAIDALETITCNFVVPLFSRDATLDIADGLTESSSTYLVDSINAYCRTHVNKMSTLKRRRNRQAFCSKRDTFVKAQQAAANLAAYRCDMTFQDVKYAASAGITQFQPWMAGVLAAGMQAAGFYKGLVRKGINISGCLQAAGDFNDQNDDQMELALQSGLLPIKVPPEGTGYVWVSDQSSYGKDSNFVYNSTQAVYVSDTIALTIAQRMERMFVGQSVADISASLAVTALQAIMDDMKRLKLIAASTDAPKGYKNIVIQISGTAMIVSLEVKLAGLLYFIPVSVAVQPVQQSATG